MITTKESELREEFIRVINHDDYYYYHCAAHSEGLECCLDMVKWQDKIMNFFLLKRKEEFEELVKELDRMIRKTGEFDEFCKTCDQHIPYDCECDTYNAAISESMTKIKDRI